MKIYLAGASGRLGREILKKIPKAIPLVRKPLGIKGEIITKYNEDLKEILKDADVVIISTGSLKFWDKDDLYNVNYELTKKILKYTPKHTRIIYISSVSVYGDKEGVISEETEPNPISDYSKSKFMAEKEIMKRQNWVILRVAAIYGKEYNDYKKFLLKIKMNKIQIIGDGKNHVPFVYVGDVAYAVKEALNKGQGIYIISGESKTQEEIYDIAASVLNVKLDKKYMSKELAYMYASFQEFLAKIFKIKPKITKEHVKILTMNRIFSYSRAKKDLNFTPKPLKEGIKEIVKEINI